MIGMHVRVQNVANGSIGDGANRRKQFFAGGGEPGIDQQNTVLADLQRNVATCTNNHVDIAANRQQMHFTVSGTGLFDLRSGDAGEAASARLPVDRKRSEERTGKNQGKPSHVFCHVRR